MLGREAQQSFQMEHSRPILDAFSTWLRHQISRVLPKSALGPSDYLLPESVGVIDRLPEGRTPGDRQ